MLNSIRTMRGFTLLEVLIAVIVFSLGLLGVAGMVLTSMRGNHTAQLHTQATFVAQWIADAMRANPAGVIAGQYDGPALSGAGGACMAAGCTTTAVATRDRQVWGDMLAQALPAGQGTIRCALNQANQNTRVPAGLCQISLTWSEATETQKVSASNATANSGRINKRLDWVINP